MLGDEDLRNPHSCTNAPSVKFLVNREMLYWWLESRAIPWGRMTAFFADPEGNIHEFYSLREGKVI